MRIGASERDAADERLTEALVRFPEALRVLADKMDVLLRPALTAADCYKVSPTFAYIHTTDMHLP